jgi:hypothetical protein
MCGRFTEMLPWPELIRLYRLTDRWFGRNVRSSGGAQGEK